MKLLPKLPRLLRAACLGLLATGCGSVPLEYASPGDYRLGGQWVLTEGGSGTVPSSNASFRSGFMTQDFPLLVTRTLSIEQDAGSMGIEYDGGDYRDVTWGERRRGIWEVRAGWHAGDLHIFSSAPDTSALEVWHLSEDGNRLSINIQVRGDRPQTFERRFVRATKN